MELDQERCYQAVLSRDPRFDGRFFTGVRTTGIYCRPVCPARPPRPENVRFFACAAAAEEAGFRPCMRCRPETSPGTPAWIGTSSTVSRALRLISAGLLDDTGIDELADRLGVGSRHLRRLFDKHLGTSPIAIAQSRRTHFAKRLIDATNLPMSEVAAASGFSSLRRFNAAILSTFGRSPTEIRKASTGVDRSQNPASIRLRLSYRPPFDWPSLIRFFSARAVPGIEEVDHRFYRRSIRVDQVTGILEVRHDRALNQVLVTLPAAQGRGLIRVIEQVRALFDLHADPERIRSALRGDPRLAVLARRRPGLRLPGGVDPFETSVRVIIGQQISVAAASTLTGRLVQTFGDPLGENGRRSIQRLFPTAEKLAKHDLSTIGLTRARAQTIRRLAAAVSNSIVSFESATDPDQRIERLRSIRGIGQWTAELIAMRAYGEPDVFPAADLGLRRALSSNGTLPTESELRRQATSWSPWRSYAAQHLWTEEAVRRGRSRR